MTKLELTKTVATIIVGSGTTKIVGQVVRNNTDPKNLSEQIQIAAGTVAIGALAADVTKAYTGAKIDAAAAWWQKNIKKND